jgi:hypothetical protein
MIKRKTGETESDSENEPIENPETSYIQANEDEFDAVSRHYLAIIILYLSNYYYRLVSKMKSSLRKTRICCGC